MSWNKINTKEISQGRYILDSINWLFIIEFSLAVKSISNYKRLKLLIKKLEGIDAFLPSKAIDRTYCLKLTESNLESIR